MIFNPMTIKTLRRALPILIAFTLLSHHMPVLHAQSDNDANQLISTFQQVEDSWTSAVNNHDQFALENVLSPQFVGISAQGAVTNRDQQIAALFNKDLPPAVLDQKVVTVRTYAGLDGANVAVVSGTYALKTKDGRDVDDERGIFTQVFLYDHNRWVCINSQRTIIISQVLPKTKLSPSKSSSSIF
jgi:hypothetical protein